MDELELRQSLEREKKACQMAFMVAMECFMGNYS